MYKHIYTRVCVCVCVYPKIVSFKYRINAVSTSPNATEWNFYKYNLAWMLIFIISEILHFLL